MGYANSKHQVASATPSEDPTDAPTSITSQDAPPSEQKADEPSTSRRNLFLYGAAALGAAAAAGIKAAPAEAADGGNMLIGSTNSATSTTRLNATGSGYGL